MLVFLMNKDYAWLMYTTSRQIWSWILILVISITPLQLSFAQDTVNMVGSMEMMMEADCLKSGKDLAKDQNMQHDPNCNMDHETQCQSSFYNCLSQFHTPTFPLSESYQWVSDALANSLLPISDERVTSYYPDSLKRPPRI